ncbi:hypothetical protein R9C00_06755 [Flammeovirgaceae bacterium SG7u.111]|nr:hypothetical protein [Flammeovirgaceae bacterium SG7u.132]WPO37142.1 hypothetical protein R9C00_06755 [Flammeovirgaceae bacterium SG7u.111]
MMKRYTLLLSLLLFTHLLMGQKEMDIPQNNVNTKGFAERLPETLQLYDLEDLRYSPDSLGIRIWKQHSIFTLQLDDSISCEYKIHTKKSSKPISSTTSFPQSISQPLLEAIMAQSIWELEDDDYRGIDGSFVYFEIATPASYKVLSIWSGRLRSTQNGELATQLLNLVNTTLETNKLTSIFLDSLSPGCYRWGMSGICIDKFLGNEVQKTDFYSYAENRIKSELNITEDTGHYNYPIVIINNKPAKLSDLNQYSMKDMKSLDILSEDNGVPALAIYGTRAKNGVVVLTTKK